ncbi:MAG TPA: hypothetical protein VFV49_00255, partial [Thermoanaerobaculia bacterium]|nr:hypothetical protein [Thermoanaerobaculia bacterium]
MAILPLFPELELLGARVEAGQVVVTVKNVGAFTIRTRTYGQPEYRLIAKLFDGEAEVQDRWLGLPRDLAPGQTATLVFPRRAEGTTLRLYHALQDVPMVEAEQWAEVRDV